MERVHELDDADRVCPSCGGQLQPWAGQSEDSEEVDVIERRVLLVNHRRQKYRCNCGGCVETAPGPKKLIAGGRYSTGFAVHVAVAKYADHLPLERQVRMLRRAGLEVTSQTLWDQVAALASALQSAHERLLGHLVTRPVVGADETHWPLLVLPRTSGDGDLRTLRDAHQGLRTGCRSEDGHRRVTEERHEAMAIGVEGSVRAVSQRSRARRRAR